jgi:hypothetical protein
MYHVYFELNSLSKKYITRLISIHNTIHNYTKYLHLQKDIQAKDHECLEYNT